MARGGKRLYSFIHLSGREELAKTFVTYYLWQIVRATKEDYFPLGDIGELV
jgi:hypothetical protein